jgi:hypothetical protein
MKMKINSKDFRVRKGDEFNLRKWPTNVMPVYKSREQYHKLLAECVARLTASAWFFLQSVPAWGVGGREFILIAPTR